MPVGEQNEETCKLSMSWSRESGKSPHIHPQIQKHFALFKWHWQNTFRKKQIAKNWNLNHWNQPDKEVTKRETQFETVGFRISAIYPHTHCRVQRAPYSRLVSNSGPAASQGESKRVTADVSKNMFKVYKSFQ